MSEAVEKKGFKTMIIGLIIVVGLFLVGVGYLKLFKSRELAGNSQSSESEAAVEKQMPEQTKLRTFQIEAVNFSFSQPEIRVNQDDKVKIILTSKQGFHDWVVDEFETRTEQISEGKTATVEFVASKEGEFEFYCSVDGHRAMGMVGKLIVMSGEGQQAKAGDGCVITGCSSQICAEGEVITTCEYLPAYSCYAEARCERQSDGQCGWTETPALRECFAIYQTVPNQ